MPNARFPIDIKLDGNSLVTLWADGGFDGDSQALIDHLYGLRDTYPDDPSVLLWAITAISILQDRVEELERQASLP